MRVDTLAQSVGQRATPSRPVAPPERSRGQNSGRSWLDSVAPRVVQRTRRGDAAPPRKRSQRERTDQGRIYAVVRRLVEGSRRRRAAFASVRGGRPFARYRKPESTARGVHTRTLQDCKITGREQRGVVAGLGVHAREHLRARYNVLRTLFIPSPQD